MTAEKMCSPRQMFAMLGWQPVRNATNRATSWDDVLDRRREAAA